MCKMLQTKPFCYVTFRYIARHDRIRTATTLEVLADLPGVSRRPYLAAQMSVTGLPENDASANK